MSTLKPSAMSAARARAPLPEEVDVAIVGAGLAGLRAAAGLAMAGVRVAVFDAHYVAGGCATMFQRKADGGLFRFDVGLHYCGDWKAGGNFERTLAPIGVDIDWRPLDPDGFDTLVFPDLTFRVPASRDAFRDRLVEHFPKEKAGIDRYIRFLRETDHVGRAMDASGGRPGFGLLATVALHGRMLARYQRATIADVLDSCTKDVRLRAILLGQHGDYGLPPDEVAAVLHAGLQNHYLHGAAYPRGGGQVIADRIAERVEAHGGTIHLRAPVERICIRDGRAVGVDIRTRKDGIVHVRARQVLSAADYKRTMLELVGPESLPGDLVTRVRESRMAAALFLVAVGVRGDLAELGLGATNLWESDGYDPAAMYRATGPMRTFGSYITSGTSKDPGTPGHAPDGYSTAEVMTVVPIGAQHWGVETRDADRHDYEENPTYREAKARIEAELLARFRRLVPNAADRIVFTESATPMTHSRYTRASDGSSYGLAATPSQFLDRRPGYRTPIPGLFLTGVSTRAGHGIIGALLGGKAAAHVVLKARAGDA